jgi:hypothetical protein
MIKEKQFDVVAENRVKGKSAMRLFRFLFW